MAERSTIVKIRGVVVQRIRGLCAAWSSSCKTAGFVCMVLLSLLLEGCMRPPSSNPLTLTFLDPGTSPAEVNAALQGFTQETGIQVKHLPAPESSVAQLALLRNLLQAGSVTPDVYGILLLRTHVVTAVSLSCPTLQLRRLSVNLLAY
jgi:hypothetical protein